MSLIALHQRTKNLLRRSAIGDTALHIHCGLAVWLVAVLLIGKGPSSPWPVVVTFALECANELLDRLRKGVWLWRDTLLDIVHTMWWPVVLWLGARALDSAAVSPFPKL